VKVIENAVLSATMESRTYGPLKLDRELFKLFLSLPEDPLPGFQGALAGVRGRGKDHPRYGRWMHAFTKFYKPDIVVEVGTNAGGSAVGIARSLVENGRGQLICIDNGEGVPRSFPDVARRNIRATGLDDSRFELVCEDSLSAVPRVAVLLKAKVGLYLVDAAHTFETALADIENGLPMMKPGGFILVHDVDTGLDLGLEKSAGHAYPVFEAFKKVAGELGLEWCILKFIRKHLGVMRIP
jgi:predicted O-methyltransferase YrrM